MTVIGDDGRQTKADTLDGEASKTITMTLILVETSEGDERLTDSSSTTKGKRPSAQTGSIESSCRCAE